MVHSASVRHHVLISSVDGGESSQDSARKQVLVRGSLLRVVTQSNPSDTFACTGRRGIGCWGTLHSQDCRFLPLNALWWPSSLALAAAPKPERGGFLRHLPFSQGLLLLLSFQCPHKMGRDKSGVLKLLC